MREDRRRPWIGEQACALEVLAKLDQRILRFVELVVNMA
jgi:hypothetical protein